MNRAPQIPVIHVRFDGRSFDIPLSDLDLGTSSHDEMVKRILGNYLEVSPDKFRHYMVDRHATGNLTLRPQAVFG
jgi:hypothetical protein